MATARWSGAIVAQSDDTVVVEGNHYFPHDAVNGDYLQASDTTSVCGWKGVAHYYALVIEGKTNADAAWYYPEPKSAAGQIAGRVAFWKGVEVS